MTSKAIPLFFLIPLLAGCMQFPSETTNEKTCYEYTCLADPNSPDAQYMLETYGVHQITDDEDAPGGIKLEGDLLIWQSPRDFNQNPASDLFAYRFSTGELISIAYSDYHHYVLAQLHDGLVVYTVEPQAGAHDLDDPMVSWLMLWNATTGETRRLETGLDGVMQQSYDFDGDWVLVANKGTPKGSEDAFWAHNIHDGRNVHIYTPLPDRYHPNGTYESFTAVTVADGAAYLGMSRRPPDENITRWITRIDLDTDERSEIYRGPEESSPAFSELAIRDNLLFGTSAENVGFIDMNFDIREWSHLPPPGQTASTAESISSEWVVMQNVDLNRYPSPFTIWAYRMDSGESKMIFTSTEVFFGIPHINGERVVISISPNRGENFEAGTATNLYWMPLSELEKKWNEAREVVE